MTSLLSLCLENLTAMIRSSSLDGSHLILNAKQTSKQVTVMKVIVDLLLQFNLLDQRHPHVKDQNHQMMITAGWNTFISSLKIHYGAGFLRMSMLECSNHKAMLAIQETHLQSKSSLITNKTSDSMQNSMPPTISPTQDIT